MKPGLRLATLLAALAALPFIYGGCVVIFSSGDHHHDEDKPEHPVVIAPGIVTTGNAVVFASGALAGGLTSADPTALTVASSLDNSPATALRTLRLPLMLAGALRRFEPDLGAVSQASGSVAGDCGGLLVYTLDVDRVSETFSGSLVFEDYCEDRFAVSAQTVVNGMFEASSGTVVSADFVFEDLSAGGLSYDGELQLDIFGDTLEAVLNADATEAATANVFRLEDYLLAMTAYPGYFELEASGTYVHPDYGAVALDTTDPFIVHREDDWPSSGAAVVSGGNGTAAALTAVDHLRFMVEVDTDGGGRFDRDAGIHFWDFLE